jgi:hypothetical protein
MGISNERRKKQMLKKDKFGLSLIDRIKLKKLLKKL